MPKSNMLDEQQETLLAQGLRDGHAHAWQTLYDAYAEQVWRGVARILGPRTADVADVVQETMLAAARSAKTFDPGRGTIWQWLWGIARNHVALYFRKQQARRPFAESDGSLGGHDAFVLDWLEANGPTPPEAFFTVELAALVRATLVEISADYALLLTERYLEGTSVAEIALRDHAGEVAVRSKLARARQAFRLAFGKYAEDFTSRAAEAKHEPQ